MLFVGCRPPRLDDLLVDKHSTWLLAAREQISCTQNWLPKILGKLFCELQERKFNRLGVLLLSFFSLEQSAGPSSVAIFFETLP